MKTKPPEQIPTPEADKFLATRSWNYEAHIRDCHDKIRSIEQRFRIALAALEEIKKCEGVYDPNPSAMAANVINNMESVASRAISAIQAITE